MRNDDDIAKIIREIKMVQIKFDQNLNKILSKFDLTSSQAPILKMIVECEKEGRELQQKDIEEFFYLKNPTVTGILDRLESKKYIVRKLSKEDRRKRCISPTKKGREISNNADKYLNEYRQNVVKGVNKEEFETCANIINKMVANIKLMDEENKLKTE